MSKNMKWLLLGAAVAGGYYLLKKKSSTPAATTTTTTTPKPAGTLVAAGSLGNGSLGSLGGTIF